jgi:hypothetical protein
VLGKAIDVQDFFGLPAHIGPEFAPLHQPDLFIEIAAGDRTHKVNLYDPAEVPTDPRAKRFLALWTEVFKELPLKPSWTARSTAE